MYLVIEMRGKYSSDQCAAQQSQSKQIAIVHWLLQNSMLPIHKCAVENRKELTCLFSMKDTSW